MGKLYNAYLKSYDLKNNPENEFFSVAGDVFFREEVQGLEVFPQHSHINRLQHITSVAYLSFLISRKLKWNVRETTRAAVLHDLFYYDWHENDWSHRPHGYRHPGFALKNAKELCGKLTKLEENAIVRHMWPLTPTPPRYKEAYVLVFADKYCAARECLVCYFSYFDKRFKHDRTMLMAENRE